MNWLSGFNWRTFAFGVGAFSAVASAIDLAQKGGAHVTLTHLIAVGGVALTMYTMKYHGDVTSADAQEQVARAKRESMFPPMLPVDPEADAMVDKLVNEAAARNREAKDGS